MEESKLVTSDEDDRHALHTQEKQPPKKKIGFCFGWNLGEGEVGLSFRTLANDKLFINQKVCLQLEKQFSRLEETMIFFNDNNEQIKDRYH